jgi:hypothetical protein
METVITIYNHNMNKEINVSFTGPICTIIKRTAVSDTIISIDRNEMHRSQRDA